MQAHRRTFVNMYPRLIIMRRVLSLCLRYLAICCCEAQSRLLPLTLPCVCIALCAWAVCVYVCVCQVNFTGSNTVKLNPLLQLAKDTDVNAEDDLINTPVPQGQVENPLWRARRLEAAAARDAAASAAASSSKPSAAQLQKMLRVRVGRHMSRRKASVVAGAGAGSGTGTDVALPPTFRLWNASLAPAVRVAAVKRSSVLSTGGGSGGGGGSLPTTMASGGPNGSPPPPPSRSSISGPSGVLPQFAGAVSGAAGAAARRRAMAGVRGRK